jgi:hypothetical protein
LRIDSTDRGTSVINLHLLTNSEVTPDWGTLG